MLLEFAPQKKKVWKSSRPFSLRFVQPLFEFIKRQFSCGALIAFALGESIAVCHHKTAEHMKLLLRAGLQQRGGKVKAFFKKCGMAQAKFKSYDEMPLFRGAKRWQRACYLSTATNRMAPPFVYSARIDPLCISAMLLAMESPTPKPPVCLEREWSGR